MSERETPEPKARVFCFGVGDDVDYQFIDSLSRENRGYTANVAPNENLEQPLSDFYAKIKSPVLTNIAVEITGARIYDMLPEYLPDLFLGSQLVLAGRFEGTGSGNVKVSGKIGEQDVVYNYPIEFSDTVKNDFIPRQWATRRVGYLLEQIRLYGQNQELVDEIVKLARKYGIITPYTSMLVTRGREDHLTPVPIPTPMGGATGGGGGGGYNRQGFIPPAAAPSGQAARQDSAGIWFSSKRAKNRIGGTPEAQETVRYAGNDVHVDNDGFWVDSDFADSGLEPIEIKYLSDEYYKLISDEPDIAQSGSRRKSGRCL